MQTHPLNLTAATPATSINISGRAFRYIDGSSLGNARIVVKPENGNEMELKPGQGFKLTDEVGRWFVKSFDGVSAITGTLNIGSGDFEDNNVLLSGTTNANILNQPTVNLAAGTKVQEEIIAYTGSYVGADNTGLNVAQQIVSEATNVNGVTILSAGIEERPAATENAAFIAKAGAAPASLAEGDVLLFCKGQANNPDTERLAGRLRVPAGRAIYYICNHTNAAMRHMLYVVH